MLYIIVITATLYVMQCNAMEWNGMEWNVARYRVDTDH